MAFHMSVFMKLKNTQQPHMQTPNTKFHSKCTINVGSTHKSVSITKRRKTVIVLVTKLTITEQIVMNISCTKFYAYQTKNV